MENRSGSRVGSLGRSLLALAVLLVAGWLLLKVIIGVVAAVAWTLLGLAAVVAVLWAVKVLLW